MLFSSLIIFDEDRVVLLVLGKRILIYCYYDMSVEKGKGDREVESELFFVWRRVWWVKGF